MQKLIKIKMFALFLLFNIGLWAFMYERSCRPTIIACKSFFLQKFSNNFLPLHLFAPSPLIPPPKIWGTNLILNFQAQFQIGIQIKSFNFFLSFVRSFLQLSLTNYFSILSRLQLFCHDTKILQLLNSSSNIQAISPLKSHFYILSLC